MAIPTDTTPEAQQVQLHLLRGKTAAERLRLAMGLSSATRAAARQAIGRRYPDWPTVQIERLLVELDYGRAAANSSSVQGEVRLMATGGDLIDALRPVVAELDRLGVGYYVGGSVASSVHGAPRSTLDIDLSAELDESHVRELVRALDAVYYVSQATALDAVRRRSCFNLVHYGTSYKIDIFVSRGRDFDRSVQERAISEMLGEAEPLKVRIASAEDILLIKLEWYRLGEEASERQWTDVTRVAQLQGALLDREYLRHWAAELGVADLLDRLFAEIQRGGGPA